MRQSILQNTSRYRQWTLLLFGILSLSGGFAAGSESDEVCTSPQFDSAKTFPTADYPQGIVASDFNRDGKLDLATANFISDTMSVLPGNGSRGFDAPVTFPVGSIAYALTVGDFNGDGLPDIVTANEGSDTVSLLLNISDTELRFAPAASFDGGQRPHGLAAADFNGDGKLDLAVADYGSDTLSVLLGDGVGNLAPPIRLPVGSRPESAISGDFDGDGKPDLAIANENANTVSLLLNTSDAGSLSFGPPTDVPVGTGPFSLVVGDFNSDKRPDLAVANRLSNSVSMIQNLKDGVYTVTSYGVGSNPRGLIAVDFDKDGNLDLAAANSVSDTVSFLKGGGDGSFTSVSDLKVSPGEGPTSLVSGDFDRNGKPDLATANLLTSDVSILLSAISCNHVPVLSPIPDQNVKKGAVLTFTASVSDPDAVDTPNFSLVSAPSGASIVPKTGVFTWDTSQTAEGEYAFMVQVADSGEPVLTDQKTVRVRVDGTPPATTLQTNPSANTNGWFNSDVSVTLSASDGKGSGGGQTFYTLDGGAALAYSGPFTISGESLHTVVYWSVDTVGNEEAHHSDSVNIDRTRPKIAVPADGTQANDPGVCGATVDPGATASDGLSGIAEITGVRSDLQPLDALYPVGVTTITWTATDKAGNSTTLIQTITVNDAEKPKLVFVPANLLVPNDPGTGVATVQPGVAKATDNCGMKSVVGIRSDGLALNAPYPVGETRILWIATDNAGNSTAGAQKITVNDTEKPRFVRLPVNIIKKNDAGLCSALLNVVPPQATDNYSSVKVTGKRSDGLRLSAPYPVGVTTILWTATDKAGNSTTLPQTITVQDTEAPLFLIAVANPPVIWPPDGKLVDVSLLYMARDNCDPHPVYTPTVTSNRLVNPKDPKPSEPDFVIVNANHIRLRADADKGQDRIYTILITCKDNAGNVSTQTLTVKVVNPKPSKNSG